MLTLFTTAKPFRGHIATIQRNALKSWKLLHPDVEIIVFGEDEGSLEVCHELGLRHEPEVARTGSGAIRLDDMFQKAQALACHSLLCYVNSDIILLSDFVRALQAVKEAHPEFLMVGRRTDLDIGDPLPFGDSSSQEQLATLARATGRMRGHDWIDYFAFPRGLFGPEIPPFAIGRTSWDNWLVARALSLGKRVVDATADVLAIHQNHDYSHHPQGREGVWSGPEAILNTQLAGGRSQFRTIADATEILRRGTIYPNPWKFWSVLLSHVRQIARFLFYRVILPSWHLLLDLSRPLRHRFGVRSGNLHHREKKPLPPV